MSTSFRAAAVAVLVVAAAAPVLAQPKDKPIPEPLPMGVPYVYQPGNPYWYAPAVPVYAPYRVAPAAVAPAAYAPAYVTPTSAAYYMVPVSYPYPFASSGPVYGRYSWDYTGFSHGSGWYPSNLPHYPYSYQYPTLNGRVWMGFGW